MKLGPWLKILRLKLGRSQKAMAAALGREARETIWGIETEKQDASEDTLQAIADLCEYESIEELKAKVRAGEFPDLPAIRKRDARLEIVRNGEVGLPPTKAARASRLRLTADDSAILRQIARKFNNMDPDDLLHLLVINEKNRDPNYLLAIQRAAARVQRGSEVGL